MKKLVLSLKELFSPKYLYNLDTQEVLGAMADPSVRKEWLYELFEELKRLNLEIDRRLLMGKQLDVTDLASRRKAYQDVLESVLIARRRIRNPNPKDRSGSFDLDSVTVQSV